MLNGKSLGKKQNPKNDSKQRNQIRWKDITYADGKLKAIAYTSGKVVARHKIETTGKAVRLIATPEDNTWQADGTDLMHVRIEAVDSKDVVYRWHRMSSGLKWMAMPALWPSAAATTTPTN